MMGWPTRRRAHVAPIVVIEPSKLGPDAILVLEYDESYPEEYMAAIKDRAEAAFGMKVVVLGGGLKVARVGCGVMEKNRRCRA